MTLRGARLGVLTLSVTGSHRRLGPEQLELAEEFARRAAVAVDNARTHQQRSAIARTLQNSLLPPVLPEIAGIDSAALYRPAGDGHRRRRRLLRPLQRRRGRVDRGDRRRLRQGRRGRGGDRARPLHDPHRGGAAALAGGASCGWLNDAMRRQDVAGRFCTITCVHLDTGRARIRVTAACGGHPPALLRRADGRVEEVGELGTLLGLVPDPTLGDARAELEPGDTLLLYTDGITEARAPERVISRGAAARGGRDGPGRIRPGPGRAHRRRGGGQGGDAAAGRHRRRSPCTRRG